jgi:hypothetical protein
LDRHQTIFGRAPDLAAGDRGFSSATNEQAATDSVVRCVVLDRCRYHGEDGMHRWVGSGVIANIVVSTATFSDVRTAA